MELFNVHSKVVKVWPYRTAYLYRASLEVPWSKAIEDSLVRLAPEFASNIKGKNHIVIGLEGGLYLWISDSKVYIGNQLVEESW
jgi:hypothetical protein